jgi:eukaryotic-like serine/threonine-protein kinase
MTSPVTLPDLAPACDALAALGRSVSDTLLLKTVGNYQVLAEVARGGMGSIYLAVQLDVGRPVALKVLAARASATPRARERFRQEAAVAARLHHTHLVTVFGTAEAEGREAYAMPFIDGPSLAEVLADLRRGAAGSPVGERLLGLYRRRRPEYFRQVAELTAQAAEALGHAHRHGVLHRDVKPANLLVEEVGGRLHLWLHDFGLARTEGTDDFARLARPGRGLFPE